MQTSSTNTSQPNYWLDTQWDQTDVLCKDDDETGYRVVASFNRCIDAQDYCDWKNNG